MPTADEKRATFRALHESGCFVIPNPWDLGSAHYLASLGFRALATTSSGFAWSRGRADNGVTLLEALAHLTDLCANLDLPINADFEGGFATEPAMVASNVKRALETGVAGISIEDSTGDPAKPLFDFSLSVERVRAASNAIEGTDTVLVGRSEGFIVGRPDLEETIRRLKAYSAAGADCLYAPGIKTPEQIAAVVQAVSPNPVNVLVGSGFTTVAELAALGVRRISVGGALARTAWGGFLPAAREIAEHGTFTALGSAAPFAEVDGLFERD